jgi:hypothetical protein
MSKQLIYICFLILVAHISSLNLKLQTKSNGCSISLKKMPRNDQESIAFISKVQDDLDDFSTCKYFYLF